MSSEILFQTNYLSPIGNIVITGTSEYICSVSFREEKIITSNKLPEIVKECKQQLKEYFAEKRKTFSFALQQEGTNFQQLVWTQLLTIPFGKTCSYLHIADSIGDKKSIRAVGNANGKNKIAIIVPCHRVIGKDGQLVGYAGELWRKDWLLQHENKIANGVQKLF